MTLPPFPERAGHPPRADLAARRSEMAAALAADVWANGASPPELDLDGVRALIFSATGPARATVLHFHGGGYGIECPEMMGPFARALAARCSVDVICPSYRLAPDHPMPAAINDAWRAWAALRRRRTGSILLSGDSAGGGLAASVASLCRIDGVLPVGLALLSPWLDLSVGAPSFEANAQTDPVFSRQRAEASAAAYLQGHDATDPLASPLFAPLEGFPPTFISVGAHETLVDDSDRFYGALLAAAVPTRLLKIDAMEHVALTRGIDKVGARETFDELSRFVDALIEDAI